ncbi:MAG: DUF881 domain-containing protein [Actinomycetia bacterium]|nr:DUF881 domain-containing protein [Actinomycetes bacterium]
MSVSTPPNPPTTAEARHRLGVALRPRRTRTQAMVGALFVVLGFALATQVRTTAADDGLSTAREEDLVRILDDLGERNDRLAGEIRDLEDVRDELLTGTDQSATAIEEARARAAALGILAGTVPAVGPGVVVTVRDPQGQVDAAALLDAVQELRDAGAEAIQIGSVRVVAQTALLDDDPGSVVVDGRRLEAPYTITAIGDPRTLASALRIPGGVVESLRNVGGDAVVAERDEVEVTAVRPAEDPRYSSPAASR